MQNLNLRPLRRLYVIDDIHVAVTLHEPSTDRPVPEALVHRLWHEQRFDRATLTTSDGRPLTVIDPGTPNTDAGPDFLDAHLHLAGQTWRGAVEIHRTSGDWRQHEHHRDPRYNSVVLHVTLHADRWTGRLHRADGTRLPELVLAPRLQAPLRTLLRRFLTSPGETLPCAPHWSEVPAAKRRAWFQRLGRARLDAKRDRLAERFLAYPNLNQLLYERLWAGLGYAKNDTAMETLARRLPLDAVCSLSEPRDLEALFLGTAHLLPAVGDLPENDRPTADYAMDLRRRFHRLCAYYDFPVMARTQWQFFRLRPANFPPLRIAQGVAWLQPDGLLRHDPVGDLAAALRNDDPVAALRNALQARPSDFWATHFRLTKSTKPRDPSLGATRIDTLIVNAVLPVLLLHAKQHEDPALSERVYETLAALPTKRDAVLRRFAQLDTRPASALSAQGMHRLYRRYCTQGRCLDCAIGQHILGTA